MKSADGTIYKHGPFPLFKLRQIIDDSMDYAGTQKNNKMIK